jgi:hypothetical protein
VAGREVHAVQATAEGGAARPPVEDEAAGVGEDHGHVDVRDLVRKPVQDGPRHAQKLDVGVELDRREARAIVGTDSALARAQPRAGDRRADVVGKSGAPEEVLPAAPPHPILARRITAHGQAPGNVPPLAGLLTIWLAPSSRRQR